MAVLPGHLVRCSDNLYGVVLRSFATQTGETFTVLLGNGVKRLCDRADLEVFPIPGRADPALQGFIELLRVDD